MKLGLHINFVDTLNFICQALALLWDLLVKLVHFVWIQ